MKHDAFLILGILVAGFSGCASNSVSDTTNDGANSKYIGPNNCKFLYPSSFFENINIFKKPISRNDILSAEKVTGSIGTTCENGFINDSAHVKFLLTPEYAKSIGNPSGNLINLDYYSKMSSGIPQGEISLNVYESHPAQSEDRIINGQSFPKEQLSYIFTDHFLKNKNINISGGFGEWDIDGVLTENERFFVKGESVDTVSNWLTDSTSKCKVFMSPSMQKDADCGSEVCDVLWSGTCDSNGYATGTGSLKYVNGSFMLRVIHAQYDGTLQSGKREGHGKITYRNGTSKEGTWSNDNIISIQSQNNQVSEDYKQSVAAANSMKNSINKFWADGAKMASDNVNKYGHCNAGDTCHQMVEVKSPYQYKIRCTKGTRAGAEGDICGNDKGKWTTCGTLITTGYYDDSVAEAAHNYCKD